jgi:hypothetical protein
MVETGATAAPIIKGNRCTRAEPRFCCSAKDPIHVLLALQDESLRIYLYTVERASPCPPPPHTALRSRQWVQV